MRISIIKILILTIMLFSFANTNAEPDYNVNTLNEPAPGYLIFKDNNKEYFGVTDNYGYRIFNNDNITSSTGLKPINDKYWISFNRDVVYIYNFQFELLDTVVNPTSISIDFHDMLLLKNGRILMLLRDNVKKDMSKIVPGGREDANLMTNVLVETDKTGQIYWKWDVLDHLNITDVTSRIDLTQKNIDLTHINSMDEDKDGNILISVRHYDQIIKINRQTSEIIWKMGGSQSKGNQFTFINDNVNGFFGFSHQHTAMFLSNGNVLLYDNGNLKEPQYSRAVEYSIDEVNMTATKVWEYRKVPDIYQSLMGSAFRLPNGNTLINWGKDIITEVRNDKTIAFEIEYEFGINYRAYKVLYNTDAVYQNISGIGDYDFNNQNYNTGIKLTVSNISGSGQSHFQRHKYAPHNGIFSDSAFSHVYPVRWVFTHKGINSISGKIRINTASVIGLGDPKMAIIYKRDKETEGIFTPLNTNYDPIKNELFADFEGKGEFVVVSIELKTPFLISPISGSGTFTNVELKNEQVKGASLYQIQLDTNISFLNPVINFFSETNINKLESLHENTKYFWRVRALSLNDTTAWSSIFWFLTGVSAPKLIAPENNQISVKKSDSLVWTEINGLIKYQVEISDDAKFLNLRLDTITSSNAVLIPYYLEPDKQYYWRVRAIRDTYISYYSEVFAFKTAMNPPFLSAPANNAVNISTSFVFSWTPSKGASSYSIEISETRDFENVAFNYYNIHQTKWNVSELLYDKKYFWRVKAVREIDSSDWSSIFEFNSILPQPKLLLPADAATEVPIYSALSWENNNESDKYSIQLATDFAFQNLVVDSSDISMNKFLIIDMIPKTKYFWRVKVTRGPQFGDWSLIRSFTTESGVSIAAPTLITPLSNSEIYVNACLVWSKIFNAESYHLQIANSESFSQIIIDTEVIKENYFTLSDLEYNKQYFWRVRAINKWTQSDWMPNSSFYTHDPYKSVKLIAPLNNETQVALNGQLTWKLIDDADFYRIQIDTKPDFLNPLIDNSTLTIPTFDYQNLSPNHTYYWRVRYTKNIQYSGWSSVWQFSTLTEFTLETPNIILPLPNSRSISINGGFEWEEIKGATKYHFILSKDAKFNKIILEYPNSTESNVNCCKLEYGVNYFWRVAAFNDSSSSLWSSVSTFLTELEAPNLTYPVNGSKDIPMNPRLIWDLTNTVSKYHVQISLDENFENTVLDKSDLENNYLDCELNSYTKYFVRIRNFNDTNESRWSNISSFTTSNTMSASESRIRTDAITISNYPNPFSGSTTFTYSNNEDGLTTLELFDIYGNQIATIFSAFFEGGTHNIKWNTGNLNSGLYYYRLLFGNNIKYGNLIIIN